MWDNLKLCVDVSTEKYKIYELYDKRIVGG